jgi:hypothetical protein
MLQTVNLRDGVTTTIRGFESHTHCQIDHSPTGALTPARALESHSRSHADLNNPSMCPLAMISQPEISQNDVPQLPSRL